MKPNVMCASQVLLTDRDWGASGYSQEFPKYFVGMHLLAFFGLDKVICDQLGKGARTDLKDEDGQTLLLLAAKHGHE